MKILKEPYFTFSNSGTWCELSFGFSLDLTLDKHIVSDDLTVIGRHFSIGIRFLRWYLAWGCMFGCEPHTLKELT
jgi:hypothetical protein